MAAALIGPAAFGLGAVAGARRVSGYRHRDEPMSALAAKDCAGAPVMVPAFLTLAASSVLLGRRVTGSRVPPAVATMMQISGAGVALAGIARQSDRSCPARFKGDANVTLSDDLHVLFSMCAFGPWMAMPFVMAARGRALHPSHRLAALTLGTVGLGGQVWTAALIRRNAPAGGGTAQRVTVAAALAFYPLVALAARD
jgi:hypothetical protein